MSKTVRHVSSVAGATLVSRVLGLARDVLMFAGLGAGPYLSAFVVAFTLPNLLRRLLGEGALTSAVIPVLAHRYEQDGRGAAFSVLNRVLSRLVGILLAATLAGGILLLGLTLWPGLTFRWELAGKLAALLLPYGIFICASAMLAAQLNTLHCFLVPALSPVWLNLAMILALGLCLTSLGDTPQARVVMLSVAVLLGGALQMIVPGWALAREGWRPKIDARGGESLNEIWRLLLPGLVGAGIVQANQLIARLLAFSIDDSAASILYLANRLVELPYGIFAVAVTTVAFPQMARAVARGDHESFRAAYEQGRGVIWLITLPAAVGLIILAHPILALFAMGNFSSADAERTVLPLQIVAFALPFFSWTVLATRGLHSWREMRLPVRFAVVNAVLNLGLGLALMFPWQESGLAAANVVAAIALTGLMERALWRRGWVGFNRETLWTLGKLGLASGAMALALGGWFAAIDWLGLGPYARAIALVTGGVPLGILVYFGACIGLRVPELAVASRLLPGARRRSAESDQSSPEA